MARLASFHPEAAAEAEVAFDWYQRRSLAAARGFVRDLEVAIERMQPTVLKTLALGLGLLAASGVPQRSTLGYYLSDAALDVDLPATLDVAGPHAVEISRSGSLELLRRAEAILPPRATVVAAARADRRLDAQLLPDSDLWWVGEWEGVRVPYSVNALAIAYYLELGERLRGGERTRELAGGVPSSSLRYRARVWATPLYYGGTRSFTDVNVAHLELTYSAGGRDAFRFSLDRVVVLDREGEILGVYRDAVPAVWTYGGPP